MTKSRGILTPRFRWSEQADQLLRRDYADRPAQEIADTLGVKLHVVYKRAEKLGLKKSTDFLAGPHLRKARTFIKPGKRTSFRNVL